MLGEILAILTGLLSALSILLLEKTLRTIDPAHANTLKSFFCGVFMVPVAFIAGDLNKLSEISLQGLLFVIASAIVGAGVGETLLYKNIILIGAPRAYGAAFTYPLFTMAIAVIFLGEPFSLATLTGTALIVSSIVLTLTSDDKHQGKINHKALLMILVTSLSFAASIPLTVIGLRDTGIFLANTIRYQFLSLILFLSSNPRKKRTIDKNSLVLLALSGFVGPVMAGICSLYSLNLIGASKATPLISSSPFWVTMISMFSKKSFSSKLLMSSIAISAGAYFLSL